MRKRPVYIEHELTSTNLPPSMALDGRGGRREGGGLLQSGVIILKYASKQREKKSVELGRDIEAPVVRLGVRMSPFVAEEAVWISAGGVTYLTSPSPKTEEKTCGGALLGIGVDFLSEKIPMTR